MFGGVEKRVDEASKLSNKRNYCDKPELSPQ